MIYIICYAPGNWLNWAHGTGKYGFQWNEWTSAETAIKTALAAFVDLIKESSSLKLAQRSALLLSPLLSSSHDPKHSLSNMKNRMHNKILWSNWWLIWAALPLSPGEMAMFHWSGFRFAIAGLGRGEVVFTVHVSIHISQKYSEIFQYFLPISLVPSKRTYIFLFLVVSLTFECDKHNCGFCFLPHNLYANHPFTHFLLLLP